MQLHEGLVLTGLVAGVVTLVATGSVTLAAAAIIVVPVVVLFCTVVCIGVFMPMYD